MLSLKKITWYDIIILMFLFNHHVSFGNNCVFSFDLKSQNDPWHTILHILYLVIREDIHMYTENIHNDEQSKTSEPQIRLRQVQRSIQDVCLMFLISFSPRFQHLSTLWISRLESAWIFMSHWVFHNNCCPSKYFHKLPEIIVCGWITDSTYQNQDSLNKVQNIQKFNSW